MRLPTETPALLLGLIGEGIGQSLSPALYEEEAAQHGILCLYQRIDLDELRLTPAALPELLTAAEQKLLRNTQPSKPPSTSARSRAMPRPRPSRP